MIKETELPLANRIADLKPLLSCALIPVDVHFYAPEEMEEFGKERFSFINCALKSGKTLFEK